MQMIQPEDSGSMPLPAVADMRTGAYAHPAAVRHATHGFRADGTLLQCAIGGTSADECENQRRTIGLWRRECPRLPACSQALDMLNMGGLLDALKVFDFGKAVIDDEIA
jgi:hypothetical protein